MKRKTQLGAWIETELWMCGNCRDSTEMTECKVLCSQKNEIKSVRDNCDYLEPLDFLMDGDDNE